MEEAKVSTRLFSDSTGLFLLLLIPHPLCKSFIPALFHSFPYSNNNIKRHADLQKLKRVRQPLSHLDHLSLKTHETLTTLTASISNTDHTDHSDCLCF